MAILLILRLHLYSLYCIDYEIGFQEGINGSGMKSSREKNCSREKEEMGKLSCQTIIPQARVGTQQSRLMRSIRKITLLNVH